MSSSPSSGDPGPAAQQIVAASYGPASSAPLTPRPRQARHASPVAASPSVGIAGDQGAASQHVSQTNVLNVDNSMDVDVQVDVRVLQQQFNIAVTSADPQLVAEAWAAIDAARSQTQHVTVQATQAVASAQNQALAANARADQISHEASSAIAATNAQAESIRASALQQVAAGADKDRLLQEANARAAYLARRLEEVQTPSEVAPPSLPVPHSSEATQVVSPRPQTFRAPSPALRSQARVQGGLSAPRRSDQSAGAARPGSSSSFLVSTSTSERLAAELKEQNKFGAGPNWHFDVEKQCWIDLRTGKSMRSSQASGGRTRPSSRPSPMRAGALRTSKSVKRFPTARPDKESPSASPSRGHFARGSADPWVECIRCGTWCDAEAGAFCPACGKEVFAVPPCPPPSSSPGSGSAPASAGNFPSGMFAELGHSDEVLNASSPKVNRVAAGGGGP